MTDYRPELDPFRSYKLHGAIWCNRRHRWRVRIRRAKSHPDAPKNVLCRTAPEAAAYVNASLRAFQEREIDATRMNNFKVLFRSPRLTEGPENSGSLILMIEAPFCWVKLSDGMLWIYDEEWFVDPASGKPSRVNLRQNDGRWQWNIEHLDQIIWTAMGRTGAPVHVNGDEFDCRLENLADASEIPGLVRRPLVPRPMTNQENAAYRLLNACMRAILLDAPDQAPDPWEGEIYPVEDRRWLIEVARRNTLDLLDDPKWKDRAELIRLMSNPWTIQWGSRKMARLSRRRSSERESESGASEASD